MNVARIKLVYFLHKEVTNERKNLEANYQRTQREEEISIV